jgi:hypothetical protein
MPSILPIFSAQLQMILPVKIHDPCTKGSSPESRKRGSIAGISRGGNGATAFAMALI